MDELARFGGPPDPDQIGVGLSCLVSHEKGLPTVFDLLGLLFGVDTDVNGWMMVAHEPSTRIWLARKRPTAAAE